MSAPARAKTLVFMSADIAHSTVFKEARQAMDRTAGWLEPFAAFFRELPLVFMGQIASVFDDAEDLPNVWVWRVSGDDVVFLAEPEHADEAARLLKAFHLTVNLYHARISSRWPLGLRGCCWAARFPERNIEIEIPEMATAGRGGGMTYFEYLGPEVDAGFRIADHAPVGQVIVSLNLAEAIAYDAHGHGLWFHRVGQEILKGVYAEQPYPLLLIGPSDPYPLGPAGPEPNATALSPGSLLEMSTRLHCRLNRDYRLGLAALEF